MAEISKLDLNREIKLTTALRTRLMLYARNPLSLDNRSLDRSEFTSFVAVLKLSLIFTVLLHPPHKILLGIEKGSWDNQRNV